MAEQLKTPANKPAPESSGESSRDPGLSALLTGIFQAWKGQRVPFLILRNYENLPEATSNDVDVLVAPPDLAKAEQVMIWAAGHSGYLLHNRVEFATISYFFFHPGSLRQLQIDLFFSLKWHAFELLSTQAVLAERNERGLFAIPHLAHEAVLGLLTRLIYKGYVKDKYKPVILAGFRAFPERTKALLAEAFGGALAAALVEHSLAERWTEVERLWKPLQRALVCRRVTRHPWATLRALLEDALRGLSRLRRPGGITVVVLGADGSGKSTLARKVIENLRNTFNPEKGLQVHWKPVVFFKQRRRPTGKPDPNPHGKRPRNVPASLLYLAAHWLEFFLGSHFQFRPALFKNGMVLVDRYYYDFLVDQRRYRLRAPAWVIRLTFGLLKQPDLVFLLDAPPEVLQARKQEVALSETARQVEAYRRLVSSLPQGYVLDATQPVEDVAARMTARVLKFLRQRCLRRHPASGLTNDVLEGRP